MLERAAAVALAVLSAAGIFLSLSCNAERDTKPLVTTAPVAVHSPARTIVPPTMAATRPVDYAGLHNVVAFADDVYSGSVPEGTAGFESLKAMGIKTIIDVDGAAPQLELARPHGFKYVHLPVTYGGFDQTRTLELARALKDLPGPVYIHCHHGKHRSAAAAGAALVTLGKLDADEATARMKVSGTAPTYTGLYECVADAKLASASDLASASGAFPEIWKTSGMVKTMVEIDEVSDHLKAIEKAGWKTPDDHPDLVPAAEAGRLADLMRVLKEDHETLAHPPEFAQWLEVSAAQAAAIEEQLLAGSANAKDLSAKFAAVSQSCKQCHVKYRD